MGITYIPAIATEVWLEKPRKIRGKKVAGVHGDDPWLKESESFVLPITPHPSLLFRSSTSRQTGQAAWWARLIALRPGDLEGIQSSYDCGSAERGQVLASLSKREL